MIAQGQSLSINVHNSYKGNTDFFNSIKQNNDKENTDKVNKVEEGREKEEIQENFYYCSH